MISNLRKLTAVYAFSCAVGCGLFSGPATPETVEQAGALRGEGEACGKPSDCNAGLTCNDLICVDPKAVRDRQCARSPGCTEEGKCAFAAGACRATMDEHCEQSVYCKDQGACAAHDGICLPASAKHCEASRLCVKEERCFLRSKRCVWRPKPESVVQINGPAGHRLTVQRTEVTQGDFERLMGHNPSYHRSCGSNCPVEQVTMMMATHYADRLSERAGLPSCYSPPQTDLVACKGFRLPFDAEWQWLAFTAPYNGAEGRAWTKENSGFETKPVCSSGTQRFGLCDLFGNVWEW
ncbi:MAG: formylglycine-generating enzyme family protein, partial [Bradymonadia bacterium]